MFLQYFGFRDDPFSSTPDLRCLFPSHTHREALASLKYGFHCNRGFTAMIAPPGMGKTTLLYHLFQEIRQSAQTVFLFNIDSECEPREFLAYILRDIGIVPAHSSSEMHEQFTNALVQAASAGRKFVVVIDEAQNLSEAVLERVRLLTNFETSRGKLLQVVLSGQPELSEKLMQPSLAQLRQRISSNCRIDPLSADETAAYIEFRVKHAGYDGDPLFTRDAIRLIAEASKGTPRIINNLCFNALSLCFAMSSKQVSDAMVAEVVDDLQLFRPSAEASAATREIARDHAAKPERRKRPARLVPHLVLTGAAAALILLCAAGIPWLSGRLASASQSGDDEKALKQEVRSTPVIPPVEADAGIPKNVTPVPAPENIAVTVERNQSLRDISVQYLGAFDSGQLHQIQALNPKLKNPDHIEIGQTIFLPHPLHEPVSTSETSSTSERTLP